MILRRLSLAAILGGFLVALGADAWVVLPAIAAICATTLGGFLGSD